MPSLKGVTVHVTDHKGNDFVEWGVQHLRQQAGKCEKVSAYIQSTTDVQFRVSVQPRIPFTDKGHPGSESEPEEVEQMKGEEADQERRGVGLIPRYGYRSSHSRAGSEDRSARHQSKQGIRYSTFSSPIRQQKDHFKPPKYAFMASLYLDGRTTPERKIITYLDPKDEDFAENTGKVFFKNRWVQSKDGTLAEHAWVFKEKAIETVFDKLMIATNQARHDDEDAIIEAMQSSGLGREDRFVTEKSKVGQIIVDLRRIRLGQKRYERRYRSKHQEGQGNDIDMVELKSDITHSTGFAYRSRIAPAPMKVVEYSDYKPEEGNWATFQFFYRSAEQLQKFGFPGFQRHFKPAKNGRALNTRMADLTPLSITLPLTRERKKSWQDFDSFEERIKKENFKLEDDKPKLEFGSEYRDASADDEMEADESCKYAAARMPFLTLKASRGVASSLVAAKTLADLEQPKGTAESRHSKPPPSFSAPRSIPFDRFNLDHGHHPPPNPDLGDAPISLFGEQLSSATPTSLTAEQGSSPPSLACITKENVAKMGAGSRHGFRIAPAVHGETSDADDEDGDDDLNTESDLETHADDDAFEYSANPEEDEEGQHYLRSQLQGVAIKKRSHAQVEDAEEEIGGTHGNDGAVNVEGQGRRKW